MSKSEFNKKMINNNCHTNDTLDNNHKCSCINNNCNDRCNDRCNNRCNNRRNNHSHSNYSHNNHSHNNHPDNNRLCNNPSCHKCYKHKPSCDQIIINLYLCSINPSGGLSSGGNTVIINGSGFSFVKTINFGNNKLTVFTVISDDEISFIVPNMNNVNNINDVKVSVSTEHFTSNKLYYVFVLQPTITNMINAYGPINGGNQITIKGTNLSSIIKIDFGTVSITNFMIINDDTISFSAPASNVINNNTVNVSVQTLGGTSNILTYTYVLPPII